MKIYSEEKTAVNGRYLLKKWYVPSQEGKKCFIVFFSYRSVSFFFFIARDPHFPKMNNVPIMY